MQRQAQRKHHKPPVENKNYNQANNKIVKRLLIFLFMLSVSVASIAQSKPKKVAVWETQRIGDDISLFKGTLVRGAIEEAVDNTPGYVKYDRAMFDAIVAEHKFQRSGAVKDDDMRKMGEMAGVQYVIVPECAIEDGYFVLNVRMLDVESGQSKTVQEIPANTVPEIKAACTKLSARLFGNSGGSSYVRSGGGGNTTTQRGQDFTETAFGINMRMVYVEGGTFTMGCTGEQGSDCEDDESPNRQTTVSSYYIGMLEVTQSQWEKVMGTSIYQQQSKADASKTYGTGADYPMYYVSWEEAKEFCTRLSRQTGRNYTLPTEAEWEYAARGGKKNEGTKYSGGWSVGDVAWYDGNSGSSTHPCGTKRPNALGIYDMSGNVWEWCEDWYGSKYLQYDNNNPKGASSGSCRVLRGGSWSYGARNCRVSDRINSAPGNRNDDDGFRVVLH